MTSGRFPRPLGRWGFAAVRPKKRPESFDSGRTKVRGTTWIPLPGRSCLCNGRTRRRLLCSAPGLRDHFHPLRAAPSTKRRLSLPRTGMYSFPSQSLTDDIISKSPPGVKVSPIFLRRLCGPPRSAAFRTFRRGMRATPPRYRREGTLCPESGPGRSPS